MGKQFPVIPGPGLWHQDPLVPSSPPSSEVPPLLIQDSLLIRRFRMEKLPFCGIKGRIILQSVSEWKH